MVFLKGESGIGSGFPHTKHGIPLSGYAVFCIEPCLRAMRDTSCFAGLYFAAGELISCSSRMAV